MATFFGIFFISSKKFFFFSGQATKKGGGGLVAGPLKQNCFAASLWHANGPFDRFSAVKRLREIKIFFFGFKVY